ncbi:MAG: sulfate adenylyltransferase subunit CysN [Candidatus Acidiferrum sp.]
MAAFPQIAASETIDQFLSQELNKGLLRFTTAGSVDDGKSTLIGRLLHDCKAVYEDQLASVKKSPVNRSGRAIDFSLLTDGLRAEREQGITIDVAYRYFSTPRRKFIIADTPGHEQYTRNMATGASTADLAVILVDATTGLLPQTKQHTYIASLLGIRHLLVAVNKMDLAGFRQEVFEQIQENFSELARHLGVSDVQCVPVSALEGDNLVTRSVHTPWYSGPTMLEHLETVEIQAAGNLGGLRFPVQSVIRPDASFRGFAGRVASSELRPGDEVVALPSLRRTRIKALVNFDGELLSATAGDSVVVTLADEIDLSRGDMLVSPSSLPHVSPHFWAKLVWLHSTPLELNRSYLAKHAGRTVKAKIAAIRHRIDVNTLEERAAARIEMNGIASVEFETSQPLYFDSYENNRITGSLILIDALTNATVGAVMIHEKLTQWQPRQNSGGVSAIEREERHGHRSAIFAIPGDRTQAALVERALWERGFHVLTLAHSEATPALLKQLQELGLVLIVWNADGPLLQEPLPSISGNAQFDLPSLSEAGAATEIEATALRLAERLRFDAADHQKEVQ